MTFPSNWKRPSIMAVAAAALLATATIGARAANAEDWHHRGHDHYAHGWVGGGYYAAPPVVYGGGYYPYYAPPPVVYGPGIGVGVNLPGVSIGVGVP